MGLVKYCLSPYSTFQDQRRCSLCGKRRSFRVRRRRDDRTLDAHICSRPPCAAAKDILNKASSSGANVETLVVEVHHYHHTSQPIEVTHPCIYTYELQAEPTPEDRVELPGTEVLSRSIFRGHSGLSTILEEPPCVDASGKPSEEEVRQVLKTRSRAIAAAHIERAI